MLIGQQEAQLDPEELEDYFIIERDSGEPDSEGRLTYPAELREISQELDEQLKAFVKALKKSDPSISADKRKRDGICNAATAQALTAKLEQYPTSVEEDEALLKQTNLAKRHRMAVEVRLGEKMLLREVIALTHGGSITSGEAHEDRPTKRAKTKA
jgi:SET domain-containing protein 6